MGINRGLNSGLAYLAGHLIENGYPVHVLDFNNSHRDEEERLEEVKDADLVGISIKSFTMKNALEWARKVRGVNKKGLLVCGGPHISLDGFDFLMEYGIFDAGVACEGEKAALELASGKPLDKIKGILFRNNGTLIANERSEWISRLDDLAFPNYDFFDSLKEGITSYPLITSRGCPYQCNYCSVGKISGKRWRFRNPDKIIQELKLARGKYKINHFRVIDDNFTLSRERVKVLCRRMIQEDLKLKWSCPNGIRADSVDEEMMELMRKSGCESIAIGIETGVEEVFNKIGKAEKLADIVKTVHLAKDAGLRVTGFFILGLPGSTFELDRKSIQFAKTIDVESIWNTLVPYPGTEVWNWVQRNGKMLIDWREGAHFGSESHIAFETKDYTKEERSRLFYLANLATRRYSDLIVRNENSIQNMRRLIKIILRYDRQHLIIHLMCIVSKVIKKTMKLL